jgi:hypothetical protein
MKGQLKNLVIVVIYLNGALKVAVESLRVTGQVIYLNRDVIYLNGEVILLGGECLRVVFEKWLETYNGYIILH